MEDTRVTLASWSYGGMWIFYNKSVLSLRPSALNTTLPAFAAELMRLQLSIDISCWLPRSASQPHAAAAAVDRRDRQTDGHVTVT